MPKRRDVRSICLIGSGPIVIGQACEFDYAGSQALKVLREEGYRTIVVNSNPATIMTDPGFADRTYIEPLDVEGVASVLARERPDALLPTLGGQTALNLASTLAEEGVLAELGVELIGASLDAIHRAEDRRLFRETMRSVGLTVPASIVATSLRDLPRGLAFPVILRPAFTLGGHGGGIAASPEELGRMLEIGLSESPVNQVLVEESLIGWDEFELEVMRDRQDNVVVVCSIENLDPMGVHTGDSVTVAPQMTLADEEYQELRDAAAAAIRAVGVETGGSNIQFARERETGELRVIEMNPRVSRSSALASKATGYPIAKVAAKLAVGYTLDEIPNDLTGTTPASFEPTLDYVVVKFPRFAFEKFVGADEELGTQMKAVGEAMGIGRTFSEAFLKAMRSRELEPGTPTPWATLDDLPAGVHPWFRAELERTRSTLCSTGTISDLVADDWTRLKREGWSDADIAAAWNTSEEEARAKRRAWGVRPAYRRVDSCAAEVEAGSSYLYSTWGERDEVELGERPAIVVLGAGPNRIGQGIEFDYCCVHAAQTFRGLGFDAVMVNCNPETVSTDYDTSDRLYFEPMRAEEVLEICARERPHGVVIQFGGQTPLKLARDIESKGWPILGTPFDAVDLAEDRERFAALCDDLGIQVPAWGIADDADSAVALAERIRYPVLVRPSYVLGGRRMRVCYEPDQVAEGAKDAGRVLVDRFLEGAVEIDVDALCDGQDTYVAAVMQHVEEAGVHSGDSSCVLPAPGLSPPDLERVRDAVRRLGRALGVVGLFNVQLALVDSRVVRPRGEPPCLAHRSVREQGDRREPRARGVQGDDRNAARAAFASAGRIGGAGQREGGGVPVRTLPGRRPRSRPGDALHRRGDGDRRRFPIGLRQGRACGGPAAADRGPRLSLRARRRQERSRPPRPPAGRPRVRAQRDRRNRQRARAGRSQGPARAQGHREPAGRDRRRPHPPPALRPRRRHTGRGRRPLGRLPHPRGGARRAGAVHHDPRWCLRRRRGDRARAARGGALTAGETCGELSLGSSGPSASARTPFSASSGGPSSRATRASSSCSARPGGCCRAQ